MKALFIGGTGTISTAITKLVAKSGWELYLLNRGNRDAILPEGVKTIHVDINGDRSKVLDALGDMKFDVVADFIIFKKEQVVRDYEIFKGRTKQYMFISSASAYQTPPENCVLNESTPLYNSFREYSRDKIACEEFLMDKYRNENFPITIIRPSHTYDERFVPMGAHGKNGSWQILKRMIEGKRVIIQGDGTSLWTLTHNSDFAKGFVGLMGNMHAIGEAVQITSDESVTWNQIYRVVADTLGVPLKACYVPSDFLADVSPADWDLRGGMLGDKSNSVIFDNSKLKRLVPDFVATVRMDQGIADTVRYVSTHKECQNEDPEYDAWCDKVIAAMDNAKQALLK